MDERLKVVFICGDSSGPAYHDIFVPSVFFSKYNLLDAKALLNVDPSALTTADIIVFQRQYAPESYLIMRGLKQQGKVTMFICDDNVWELPNGNPAKGTYEQKAIIFRYEGLMRECHAVHTSTPYLKELAVKQNSKVIIFRNLVDPIIASHLSPGRDNPEELRILWTGTPHHHDDIVLIQEALLVIAKKYPQVKWVFMGYAPTNLAQFPLYSFEYYNFVPVDAFYPAFANLDADIGLVPLEDNPFNQAKTCRKFQEYSICKWPTIASPVGEYNRLPEDTLLRVKTNDTEGWVDGLSELIEKEEKRREIAQKAYDFIMRYHDINFYIYERAEYYYKLYEDIKGVDRRPDNLKEFLSQNKFMPNIDSENYGRVEWGSPKEKS